MNLYHNTQDEIEIGDFIKLINLPSKCKYKEKFYQIIKISSSGKSVWYKDNRTNNKCNCDNCIRINYPDTFKKKFNIVVKKIKLYQRVNVRERDIKLKLLLK